MARLPCEWWIAGGFPTWNWDHSDDAGLTNSSSWRPAGACIVEMQELMRAHYEGVSEAQFLADLRAKQWVILLHDHGTLCGFSTQVLFDHALAAGG